MGDIRVINIELHLKGLREEINCDRKRINDLNNRIAELAELALNNKKEID